MFWLVFLLSLFIDQLSKLLAGFYLEIVVNQGISFGWLSQLPVGLINFGLLLIALFLAFILKKEWQRHHIISGLFWAGVISNLIDRFLLGGITDWLPIPFTEIKNNLADIMMSLALLGLLIKEFKKNGHLRHL